MPLIPVNPSNLNGLVFPTRTGDSTSTEHELVNTNGRVLLYVSTDSTAVTLTIETAQTISITGLTTNLAVPNIDITIPAGDHRIIGPFPVANFGASVIIDFATPDAELLFYGISF